MTFDDKTATRFQEGISVIIPTYNRAEILRKTLRAYGEQEGRDRILEVLVVDDGSADHTRSVADELCHSSCVPIRYLYQPNSGLAAARNHAIREARGELILFGDDDIVPDHTVVAEHLAWHRKYPEPNVGVLGYVAWADEVHPTAFMQWSGLYGPQFHFGRFRAGAELDYSQSYFCNTSVKASFLKQYGLFDEKFRGYGWEDIEYSYRLYTKGWRLRYNPRATGFHLKYETFDQCLRRIERLWLEAWPVFLDTEAGKHSFRLWSAERAQSSQHSSGGLGQVFKPMKRTLLPFLKRFMDSRVKLPDKVYDFVWYHYSKPIMDAAFSQRESIDSEPLVSK